MMFLTGITRFYPSPVSPKGERLKPFSSQALFWKPSTPSGRKEVKPIPSPFGEGQTDTPINHFNQGEVIQHRESLRQSGLGQPPHPNHRQLPPPFGDVTQYKLHLRHISFSPKIARTKIIHELQSGNLASLGGK